MIVFVRRMYVNSLSLRSHQKRCSLLRQSKASWRQYRRRNVQLSNCILPHLQYDTEACSFSPALIDKQQFALSGALMKIFNTKSKEVAEEYIFVPCFVALRNLKPSPS